MFEEVYGKMLRVCRVFPILQGALVLEPQGHSLAQSLTCDKGGAKQVIEQRRRKMRTFVCMRMCEDRISQQQAEQ
jgi:hypothetical protein